MSITGQQLIAEIDKLAKAANYRYFYGGTSPATGFDCSGLIYDALIQLGVSNPPRTSEEQWGWTQHISQSQLEPGDLVFAQFPGDNASPGHVGIYIGGGNIFSAEDPSAGIGISTLSSWGSNIIGYGKIPNVTTSNAATATLDSATSSLGGLLSIPSEITSFFSDADGFVNRLMWLAQPSSWLRIGSFFIAIILLLGAIIVFTKADQKVNIQPVPVPI